MFLQYFCFGFVILNLSSALAAVITSPQKKYEKIVMDVDGGADDAFAISVVVKNQQLSNGPPLIAISCVCGNTFIKNVKTNVLRTLRELQRDDIPVYVGVNESLFGEGASDGFFGRDGLGDFPFDPKNLVQPRKEHAVTALIRLVSSNPGQITLMALGPLTNIALAIKLDPSFIRKLKNLVILGGSVAGIGNIHPGLEFNFFFDPEAVNIVLQKSTFHKVMLFPWDTVVKTNITKKWRMEVLGAVDANEVKFLNNAESKDTSSGWHHGDGMAVAAYIWPSTVVSIQPLRTTSVPCGQARGGLLLDYYHAAENISTSNIRVVLEFNGEEYKRLLLYHFNETNYYKTRNKTS